MKQLRFFFKITFFARFAQARLFVGYVDISGNSGLNFIFGLHSTETKVYLLYMLILFRRTSLYLFQCQICAWTSANFKKINRIVFGEIVFSRNRKLGRGRTKHDSSNPELPRLLLMRCSACYNASYRSATTNWKQVRKTIVFCCSVQALHVYCLSSRCRQRYPFTRSEFLHQYCRVLR